MVPRLRAVQWYNCLQILVHCQHTTGQLRTQVMTSRLTCNMYAGYICVTGCECMQGIFVSRVVNGGPCHEAGLLAGDKLLSVSSALIHYYIASAL